MNNTFSIKRFGMFAKSEIASNARFFMLTIASAFALFMIVHYLNHLGMPRTILHTDPDTYQVLNDANGNAITSLAYDLATPIAISWMLLILFFVINASFSFRNYFNKGYSSATMMLPAAKAEKFAYILILNMFVVPIIFTSIAALVNYGWSLAYDINYLFFDDNLQHWDFCMISAFIFFTISIYFYGAVLFRRLHFLFTMLSWAGLSTLLVVIIYHVGKALDQKWFYNWIQSLEMSKEEFAYLMKYLSLTFVLLLTTLFVVLAWQRYRKLQITK